MKVEIQQDGGRYRVAVVRRNPECSFTAHLGILRAGIYDEAYIRIKTFNRENKGEQKRRFVDKAALELAALLQ